MGFISMKKRDVGRILELFPSIVAKQIQEKPVFGLSHLVDGGCHLLKFYLQLTHNLTWIYPPDGD